MARAELLLCDTNLKWRSRLSNELNLFSLLDRSRLCGFGTIALLKAAPIQVKRNSVQIGDRRYEGDYGVFFAYPRPKTTDNLVGVVGMTNEMMIRAGQQARYFVSGVTCPDYAIYGFDSLEKGFGGVVEAGYFDNFWQLKP